MEVVIVGLGSIAARHIAALRALVPDLKLKALRSTSHAEEVIGIENIYALDEIGTPDFVLIANPTHLHFEFIKAFAQLGIPLFIEKPAVHDLARVDEILDILKQTKSLTYVACNLRFHPCLNYLKTYLADKKPAVNEVNIYCGSYLPDWRPGKDFRAIYSANAAMGGGVHLDLFHEVDYACWLFGYPEHYQGNVSHQSTLRIDAADYAHYLLKYSSFHLSIVLNYYRRTPKRTIEVLFQDETWTVDLLKNSIITDQGITIYENKDFKIVDTYKVQMAHFISSLTNKATPVNPFEESVEILKISLSNESIKS